MNCFTRALCVLVLLAGDVLAGGVYVGTNSIMVLGQPGAGYHTAPGTGMAQWTTNTVYTNGTYVRLGSAQTVFCLVGGTSGATMPAVAQDTVDGTVTWRPVLPSARQGLAIVNDGSVEAYCNILGQPAVIGACAPLYPSGGTLSLAWNTPQGAVYAVAGAINHLVAFEW